MSKKRKAWDAAIQLVAAQTGSKIDVPGKREGGKRETRRRVNARRWIATSDVDDLRRKMEARLEALEEANQLGEAAEEDDEEWMDEEEARTSSAPSSLHSSIPPSIHPSIHPSIPPSLLRVALTYASYFFFSLAAGGRTWSQGKDEGGKESQKGAPRSLSCR
jgi:hypothetical protein